MPYSKHIMAPIKNPRVCLAAPGIFMIMLIGQSMPCAIMAFATFIKPAMFAPRT